MSDTCQTEEYPGQIKALLEDNQRLRADRADILNVKTTDGLTASEWVLRTGQAERKRDALSEENNMLSWEIAMLTYKLNLVEAALKRVSEALDRADAALVRAGTLNKSSSPA